MSSSLCLRTKRLRCLPTRTESAATVSDGDGGSPRDDPLADPRADLRVDLRAGLRAYPRACPLACLHACLVFGQTFFFFGKKNSQRLC